MSCKIALPAFSVSGLVHGLFVPCLGTPSNGGLRGLLVAPKLYCLVSSLLWTLVHKAAMRLVTLSR